MKLYFCDRVTFRDVTQVDVSVSCVYGRVDGVGRSVLVCGMF